MTRHALLFAFGIIVSEGALTPSLALAQAQDRPTREEFEALKKEVETLREQVPRQEGQKGDSWPLNFKIGGQYRIVGNASNFGWHPETISDNEDTRSSVNQRFRTWVSFSPTEKVGGYLQLEVGHVGWGEDREGTKTYDAEMRRGFLRYASDDAGTFRVGIQDWHDAFGESATLGSFDAVDDYDSFGAVLANSIWDFNVGGVSWSRTFPEHGGMALNGGLFVLWEGDDARADDAYLLGMDADFPMGKEDGGIGASLYYLKDRGNHSYPTVAPYRSAWDVWFGVRATRKLGEIPLRGWVILNTGDREVTVGSDFDHTGWAAKIEAFDIALGPGKLSAQVLYSSGDDDPTDSDSGEFRTIAQSERDNFGAQGYWSYLLLSSPHGPSDVKDLGVGLQNRGLGLLTPQVKYDFPIADNLSGSTALGWLRSAEDNPTSGERDLGIEVGHTFHLDLGGGMALDFGGAYLFTGDFYRAAGGGSPDNLWETFLRMQLEF